MATRDYKSHPYTIRNHQINVNGVLGALRPKERSVTIGQSREVFRPRDEGDKQSPQKPVHWLGDGSPSGKNKSHETAVHPDSADRGRGQIQELEPSQRNRSASSNTTLKQKDFSPFVASGQKVFNRLWKETEQEELENSQVLTDSNAMQSSGTLEQDMAKMDIKARGVEHDDNSPLYEKAYELRERLEEGPLKDKLQEWDQQQEKREIEYHRVLFNRLKRIDGKVDEIFKKAEEEQDYDSSEFQSSYKLTEEMSVLREELEKGPLRDEVGAWDQQKEEMEYHQRFLNELKEYETNLLKIDRNLSEKTLGEIEEQGDNHPICRDIDRLEGKIKIIRERLEEGPLKDKLQEWDQQRSERDMEYHRGIFEELKEKEIELHEMESNSMSRHALKIINNAKEAVYNLREKVKEGPFKYEMQGWYSQWTREEKVRIEQDKEATDRFLQQQRRGRTLGEDRLKSSQEGLSIPLLRKDEKARFSWGENEADSGSDTE